MTKPTLRSNGASIDLLKKSQPNQQMSLSDSTRKSGLRRYKHVMINALRGWKPLHIILFISAAINFYFFFLMPRQKSELARNKNLDDIKKTLIRGKDDEASSAIALIDSADSVFATLMKEYDEQHQPEFVGNKTLGDIKKIATNDNEVSSVSEAIAAFNGVIKNDDKTNEKPRFILHVGPIKTGTTSIQCGLLRFQEKLLRDDNYLFLGKADCTCDHIRKQVPEAKVWELAVGKFNHLDNDAHVRTIFRAALNSFRDAGKNVIFSSEDLGSRGLSQNLWETMLLLKSVLEGWDVHVVIGYRHYFDFLLSHYQYSLSDDKCWLSDLDKKWLPREVIISFPEFFRKYHKQYSVVTSQFAMDTYQNHFDQVTMLNMHAEDDLLTNFVCNALPKADKTCNFLRNGAFESLRENQGQDMPPDYDSLAMSAIEKKLIPEKMKRSCVLQKIRQRQEQDLGLPANDFSPFETCLTTEELNSILDISLSAEELLLPEFHRGSSGEPVLRERFEKFVMNKKHCSVNGTSLLNGKDDVSAGWRDLFASLALQENAC